MENIINVEFFDQKSGAMKHLYFLHSLLGGVFYENYVTRKFRYLCVSYAIISYLMLVVTNTIRIIQQDLSFGAIVESLMAHLASLHMWILIAVVVYLKKGTLHKLFDYFDEDFRNETLRERSVSSSEVEEIPLEDISMKAIVIHCSALVIVYLSKLIQKLATSDQEFHIDYETNFFTPIPFASSQNFLVYIAFHHLTFASVILYAILFHGSIILPLLLVLHLRNRIQRLRNDMTFHNDTAFEYLDECFRREERIMTEPTVHLQLRNFQLQEIARRRDKYIEEFMMRVQNWIKIHQRWITCANLFKKFFPEIVTVEISDCVFGGVAAGYHLAKILLDSQGTGFQYIPVTLLHTTWLLVVCYIGSSLCESGEVLPEVVYSTPWYYFPKKYQKVLLNFLCMSQRDQQINVFNTYPLSLELYPTLMNNGYGYVQLMRILEQKKNR